MAGRGPPVYALHQAPPEDTDSYAGKGEAHRASIEEEPGQLVQQGLEGRLWGCMVEADIQHLICWAPASRPLWMRS